MNQFCEKQGIKREFSVARTSQQNGVAERKNRTLIEVARTMLADSKLPTTFWAEAVNTACYVKNRVLVIKPYNKTPYELFHGRTPSLSFMRPVGCLVTILNTLDHLGKFDGKADEGFFVGYSVNSKAFRVFNRSGPEWLFDIDTLTKSMIYKPVILQEIKCDGYACTKSLKSSDDKVANDVERKITKDPAKQDDMDDQDLREFERIKDVDVNNTNSIYTASLLVNIDGLSYFNANLPNDQRMPNLEDTGIFGGAYDDEDLVAGGDMNNLESNIPVSPIATTRVHKDHSVEQIIRDLHSAPQTRRMTKNSEEHGLVWTLVDLPYGKRAIGTKWVYRNKKDERGIVVRNKARLVTQGFTQQEGIDYDEVFALVARIEVIRLFLAYASFKDFVVYQMDVKSEFLYGKIEEEVYVCEPPRFEDPEFPDKVYKVEKALYGLHQAPRAWYETLSTYLLENGFQRGIIDKTLFLKRIKGDILLVQVYVDDIIFGSTKKELCTEFEKLMHDIRQTRVVVIYSISRQIRQLL
ncbi:putative ribonuclease H-like domain-containing protein [Tanacetum coccineum]